MRLLPLPAIQTHRFTDMLVYTYPIAGEGPCAASAAVERRDSRSERCCERSAAPAALRMAQLPGTAEPLAPQHTRQQLDLAERSLSERTTSFQ